MSERKLAQDQARAQIELDSINMITSTQQAGPNDDGPADEEDDEALDNEGEDEDEVVDERVKDVPIQSAQASSRGSQFTPG